MNRIQAAQQLRRALQLLVPELAEENLMEIPAVFDLWKTGCAYAAGSYLLYGQNSVGDPQLYRVLQDHTAQADWLPDMTPAVYLAIGLDEAGYPLWAQPAGSHDAYAAGDIVRFEGLLYQSVTDGNVYSPRVNPSGWRVKEGETE